MRGMGAVQNHFTGGQTEPSRGKSADQQEGTHHNHPIFDFFFLRFRNRQIPRSGWSSRAFPNHLCRLIAVPALRFRAFHDRHDKRASALFSPLCSLTRPRSRNLALRIVFFSCRFFRRFRAHCLVRAARFVRSLPRRDNLLRSSRDGTLGSPTSNSDLARRQQHQRRRGSGQQACLRRPFNRSCDSKRPRSRSIRNQHLQHPPTCPRNKNITVHFFPCFLFFLALAVEPLRNASFDISLEGSRRPRRLPEFASCVFSCSRHACDPANYTSVKTSS